MTDEERLMHSIQSIEGHLCENPPRIGDALFILECIKANIGADSLGGLNQSAPPSPAPSQNGEPLVTAQGVADTSDNATPWGNSPREIQKRAMKARTAALTSNK